MGWKRLFEHSGELLDKDKWQRDTLESIKNRVGFCNPFVSFDRAKEDHLVMTYGDSQVGKTTLILTMMGIRGECLEDVSSTLRAGIPKGNSSTSTAIIYRRSPASVLERGKYGYCYSELNDAAKQKINFCTKSEFEEELKKLRERVEKNRQNQLDVLSVYIPENCFAGTREEDRISVIDMPGVESRNEKERSHVQSLMNLYLPLASVCLVVFRGQNIQALESREIPNQPNWKVMPNRFLLVPTYAYSVESVRNKIGKQKIEQADSFYSYVKTHYREEKERVLGQGNALEIFPLELGESLATQGDTPEGVIFRKTADRMLEDLRQAIIIREGNRLKSAIEDLRAVVEQRDAEDAEVIRSEAAKLESEEQKADGTYQKAQEFLEELEDVQKEQNNELNAEIAKLKTAVDTLRGWKGNCIQGVEEAVRSFIQEYGLTGKGGTCMKDKKEDHLVLSHLRETVSNLLSDAPAQLRKLLPDNVDLENIPDMEEIRWEVDQSVCAYESRLYPRKGPFGLLQGSVSLEEVSAACFDIEWSANERIDKVIDAYIEAANKCLEAKKIERKSGERDIAKKKANVQKKRDKRDQIRAEKEQKIRETEDVEERKKRNREILDAYLRDAEEAYLKQRDEITAKLNKCSDPGEKTALFIYLGVLQRDYQRVTGGGTHEENKGK